MALTYFPCLANTVICSMIPTLQIPLKRRLILFNLLIVMLHRQWLVEDGWIRLCRWFRLGVKNWILLGPKCCFFIKSMASSQLVCVWSTIGYKVSDHYVLWGEQFLSELRLCWHTCRKHELYSRGQVFVRVCGRAWSGCRAWRSFSSDKPATQGMTMFFRLSFSFYAADLLSYASLLIWRRSCWDNHMF